ncbi:MAG TPA: hypothetical protein VF905_09445 [Nitrospirota bacterium]
MALIVSAAGGRPLSGTTTEATAAVTPIGIDTAKAIVLPTRNVHGGVLECQVSVEGTVTFRVRTDAVNPTTTVGQLYPAPTATIPVIITLRGEELISKFRIIGTAAGDSITYTFTVSDVR